MDKTDRHYSPREFAARLDAAKARAVAAHQEAIAEATGAVWAAAAGGVRVVRRRLAAWASAASASLHPG